MMSNLLEDISMCLFIAGLVGLVAGWFLGKFKYRDKLQSLQNELKLKLNKNNDTWERKLDKLSEEYTIKLNEEKNNMELKKKQLEDKIKELNSKLSIKDMEIDGVRKRLLVAKDETKRIERKLKEEYQEEIKSHKARVSNLLNRIDLRYNKDINDLIESLVTLEGNAIKNEAEIKYKLKDTKQRLENRIANLQKEIKKLKSRIHNLINAKKININIG
jgi:uncharacterized protein YukE